MRVNTGMFVMWCVLHIVPILDVRAQNEQQAEEICAALESAKFSEVANESLKNLQNLIDGGYWDKLQQTRKEKIVDAFVKQLRRGKRICQVGESEDAFNYLGYLGNIAGKLKNRKTIPILIDGLPCSVYADALAKMGDIPVSSLIEASEKGSHGTKNSVLHIFKKMQELKTVSEKNRERIKKAITRACRDNDEQIRLYAVATLESYADESDVALLKELAESDSQYYEVNTSSGPWTGYGRHKRYIVREEAQKTLTEIEKRKAGQSNTQPLQKSTTTQ